MPPQQQLHKRLARLGIFACGRVHVIGIGIGIDSPARTVCWPTAMPSSPVVYRQHVSLRRPQALARDRHRDRQC